MRIKFIEAETPLFFYAKKKKVNHYHIAINLGKGIEMKNLDKKNVHKLSLSIPLTFPRTKNTVYALLNCRDTKLTLLILLINSIYYVIVIYLQFSCLIILSIYIIPKNFSFVKFFVSIKLAPDAGLEPATCRLTAECSTY